VHAVVTNHRRRTDIDILGPFCGGIGVVSTRFIELVGLTTLERVAGLGSVVDIRGIEHSGHRTIVALSNSFVLRGSHPETAALCRECGRLLYGASGEVYALRSNLPKEPLFVSDGRVYCTDEFWKEHIADAVLVRVEAVEYPIRDESEDDLPATESALKKYLRSHRRFK
jgi:hypothetical protein